MNEIVRSAHVSPAGVPVEGMVDDRLRDLHREHGAFILRLLSWCYGVRGGDVEDVAQLVWLQVHRLGPAPEAPRSWIAKIAKNVAANERRKASRRRDQPSDGIPVDPVGPGLTAEELLSLRAYLTELLEAVPNADQREALFLTAEGLTAEEIGEVQGITPECARQRIHMARERIKRTERARLLPFFAVGFEDFIKPLPAEDLERQWENIESAIVHEPPEEDGRPPSSAPPRPIVPSIPVPPTVLPPVVAPSSPVPLRVLPLLAPKVAPALVGALLGGAVASWLLAPTHATSHELPSMERPSGSQPVDAVPALRPCTVASQTAAPSAAPSTARPPVKRPAAEPQQEDLHLRARSRRWSENLP